MDLLQIRIKEKINKKKIRAENTWESINFSSLITIFGQFPYEYGKYIISKWCPVVNGLSQSTCGVTELNGFVVGEIVLCCFYPFTNGLTMLSSIFWNVFVSTPSSFCFNAAHISNCHCSPPWTMVLPQAHCSPRVRHVPKNVASGVNHRLANNQTPEFTNSWASKKCAS